MVCKSAKGGNKGLTLDLLERYLFKKSRHQQPVTAVRKYFRGLSRRQEPF
jgi:hypothetical protein